MDGRGRVTSDPREAMREGAGLPLGGEEETGGYKGYGLALMVEVLCGVMSGDMMITPPHHDDVISRRQLGPQHPAVGEE